MLLLVVNMNLWKTNQTLSTLYFLKLQYKTKDLKYKLSGEFVQLSHNFACVVARHVATITKRHILAQGGEG